MEAFLPAIGVANLEVNSNSGVATKKLPRANNHLRWWTILLVVWLLGGWYAGSHLMRGWVPADEGAYAQSADRILHGELPHRDYFEIYTGGLAYLHAFVFKVLGENFASMRVALFVFFLPWVPTFFWSASRLVTDWVAGVVTLIAVVWSMPNYSAAVPSWYNLFFATFGMAAMLKYLEQKSTKWLFLAGVCGGCSILAKIPGLYFVAACLLFFAFYEQGESRAHPNAQKSQGVFYTLFLAVSVLLFALIVARLVFSTGGLEEVVEFVVPAGAACAVILLGERSARRRPDRERFQSLLRLFLPFAFGVLVPVAVFMVPYIRAHAAESVLRGVFVLTFRRLSYSQSPPPITTMLPTFCLASILLLGVWLRGIARWVLCGAVAILFLYFFVRSQHNPALFQIAWRSAYWMIPVVVLVGTVLVCRDLTSETRPEHRLRNEQLFLVLAVVSVCTLVQFPFCMPIFFCYVSPLAILAAVAVLRGFPAMSKTLLAVVAAGFLLFPVFRFTPPFIYFMGSSYQPNPETQPLDLPGAGNLRVEPASVPIYHRLIALIKQHAGDGEIYAAPDSPQVYFLAGCKNPTRELFDFFDENYPDLPGTLELMDTHSIRVVVLNTLPDFSPALPADIHDALVRRFPQTEKVGPFEVRWRE
jgi:hypothetical protein